MRLYQRMLKDLSNHVLKALIIRQIRHQKRPSGFTVGRLRLVQKSLCCIDRRTDVDKHMPSLLHHACSGGCTKALTSTRDENDPVLHMLHSTHQFMKPRISLARKNRNS